MQQFFLFFIMLIIAFQAFSREISGSQMSTSSKRRKFSYEIKWANPPGIARPKFSVSSDYSFPPHWFKPRNHKKRFSSGNKFRKKLKTRLCFENFRSFPRVGDGTADGPDQYIVCLYPVFKNHRQITQKYLRKVRFFPSIRQYLTHGIKIKSKRSASNSSASLKQRFGRQGNSPLADDPVNEKKNLPSFGKKYENSTYEDFEEEESVDAPTEIAPESDMTERPLTKIKFKHPRDPKIYESSLRRENFSKVDEENTNTNASRDLGKLKEMIAEVESLLKGKSDDKVSLMELEESCEPEKSKNTKGKKEKKQKGKKADKNRKAEGLDGAMSMKQKIDTVAIPILNQISAELGKMSNGEAEASRCSSSAPASDSNNKTKSGSSKSTERCSADGTWTSEVLGVDMTLTTMPNMVLKVSISSQTDSLINKKWSIHGLTLAKRGGPVMLAAIYPQKRQIASFMGQCKMCKDQDIIFGVWTIYTSVKKYTDLWRAVETKLDVLRKKRDG